MRRYYSERPYYANLLCQGVYLVLYRDCSSPPMTRSAHSVSVVRPIRVFHSPFWSTVASQVVIRLQGVAPNQYTALDKQGGVFKQETWQAP